MTSSAVESKFTYNVIAQAMSTKPLVNHKNTYICFHNRMFDSFCDTDCLEDANPDYVNYCFKNDDDKIENRFMCWRCENELQATCKKLLKKHL